VARVGGGRWLPVGGAAVLPPFGPSQFCAGPGRWDAGGEAEQVVPEEGWEVGCRSGNADFGYALRGARRLSGWRRSMAIGGVRWGGAQSARLQACGKPREPAGGSS